MRIPLFCIMAERTKHIHAQRSFRFLAERRETFANGTLAKRLLGVGETTGQQIKGTSAFFFKWPMFTRSTLGNACFCFGYG